MILNTERLLLRPWTQADASACFAYAKDPRVGPAAGWAPHTDVAQSREIIRTILMVPETYAIVYREAGRLIGSIGLKFNSDLASGDTEAELGYWIGVPFWGRGLMPEAATEVLRHAFEDLNLERVWCGYYEGNDRSRRVQEKLGFCYHHTTENLLLPQLGETRTGIANLMTREEWQHIRALHGTTDGKEDRL